MATVYRNINATFDINQEDAQNILDKINKSLYDNGYDEIAEGLEEFDLIDDTEEPYYHLELEPYIEDIEVDITFHGKYIPMHHVDGSMWDPPEYPEPEYDFSECYKIVSELYGLMAKIDPNNELFDCEFTYDNSEDDDIDWRDDEPDPGDYYED